MGWMRASSPRREKSITTASRRIDRKDTDNPTDEWDKKKIRASCQRDGTRITLLGKREGHARMVSENPFNRGRQPRKKEMTSSVETEQIEEFRSERRKDRRVVRIKKEAAIR